MDYTTDRTEMLHGLYYRHNGCAPWIMLPTEHGVLDRKRCVGGGWRGVSKGGEGVGGGWGGPTRLHIFVQSSGGRLPSHHVVGVIPISLSLRRDSGRKGHHSGRSQCLQQRSDLKARVFLGHEDQHRLKQSTGGAQKRQILKKKSNSAGWQKKEEKKLSGRCEESEYFTQKATKNRKKKNRLRFFVTLSDSSPNLLDIAVYTNIIIPRFNHF